MLFAVDYCFEVYRNMTCLTAAAGLYSMLFLWEDFCHTSACIPASNL